MLWPSLRPPNMSSQSPSQSRSCKAASTDKELPQGNPVHVPPATVGNIHIYIYGAAISLTHFCLCASQAYRWHVCRCTCVQTLSLVAVKFVTCMQSGLHQYWTKCFHRKEIEQHSFIVYSAASGIMVPQRTELEPFKQSTLKPLNSMVELKSKWIGIMALSSITLQKKLKICCKN